MEVTTCGDGYTPIVITLETKEEAELLWHIMNCPMSVALSKYLKNELISVDNAENFEQELWGQLDDIYTPCGDDEDDEDDEDDDY